MRKKKRENCFANCNCLLLVYFLEKVHICLLVCSGMCITWLVNDISLFWRKSAGLRSSISSEWDKLFFPFFSSSSDICGLCFVSFLSRMRLLVQLPLQLLPLNGLFSLDYPKCWMAWRWRRREGIENSRIINNRKMLCRIVAWKWSNGEVSGIFLFFDEE